MLTSTPVVEGLVNTGVMAYKTRDFKSAIRLLLEATDLVPRHWHAKLYLAMSYYNRGDLSLAMGLFRYLKDYCTDVEIRQKAESALFALNLKTRDLMGEMTSAIMAPRLSESKNDDDMDIQWQALDPALRQYK